MRVIPVIDLMDKQVVRGVGGRRHEYRPIESLLAADARPSTVARAFAAAGFCQVYVADLDAIAGQEPARAIYQELFAAGLDPWIDAGLGDLERAVALARLTFDGHAISGIVAGLESLESPEALARMHAAVGRERFIFSLDMKARAPLVKSAVHWRGLSALQIATLALRAGVRRFIVLDLAAVGMGQGAGTEPLCRQLRCLDPELEIIAGGGVRGFGDLRSLSAAGCNAALVASALHDGRLSAGDCAALRGCAAASV